jgi:hypothetical protein
MHFHRLFHYHQSTKRSQPCAGVEDVLQQCWQAKFCQHALIVKEIFGSHFEKFEFIL